MPELAEVALLAKDLHARIHGLKLSSVLFHGDTRFRWKIIPLSVQQTFKAMVGGRIAVHAQGKRLLLFSGTGEIAIHLGMTGRFQIEPVPAHHRNHHFMTLGWGPLRCYFLDFRRFSRMKIFGEARKIALGGFDVRRGFYLTGCQKIRDSIENAMSGFDSTPRISWLLKHGQSTGVGNYLANEALGRLELSPFEPCADAVEAQQILVMCQKVAKDSYKAGGTSFGSGYARLDGTVGKYAESFEYYQVQSRHRTVFRNRPVYSNFQHAKISAKKVGK